MKKGIIAGNFDVIHPGYIKMFNETVKYCDQLFVALHVDPSLERPEKIKPILSVEDRIEILLSLNSIYYVVPYNNEEELFLYLKENNWDIRFLGDDYKNRTDYTGYGLNIPIHYLDRSHGWSTTKFKKLISKSIKND
tara:strand:- start:7827 stop:8237 length:411 start_codon:yes stop_codon:yes gene_type:complete